MPIHALDRVYHALYNASTRTLRAYMGLPALYPLAPYTNSWLLLVPAPSARTCDVTPSPPKGTGEEAGVRQQHTDRAVIHAYYVSAHTKRDG